MMQRTVISRLVLSLLIAGVAATSACAANQTLRDRIKERRAERQDSKSSDSSSTTPLQLVTITHDGRERSYYVDPATVKQGRGAVMVFHGGEGNGTKAENLSKLGAQANAKGFVAVYPNSPGQQWNDGRASSSSPYDDVGYVRAVAADLRSRFGVDGNRLYASGVSNGGMFVQRLACDASDLFRAYAVVVANMPADYASKCRPAKARPMIFFNGTADKLMPFNGGDILASKMLGKGVGGKVLSNAQTQSFWTQAFGCGNGSLKQTRDEVNDGTSLKVIEYDCQGSVDLDFYIIEGGGHNWPGSGIGGGRLSGNVSREVSATNAMVAFFDRYGL